MTYTEQVNNYWKVELILKDYEKEWSKIWEIAYSGRSNYWEEEEYIEADKEQHRLYKEAHELGWTLKCRGCRNYYATRLPKKSLDKI